MLPMCTQANNSCSESNRALMSKTDSTETNMTVEIKSSNPTVSKSLIPTPAKNYLQAANDPTNKRGCNHARSKYQYIKPQTRLTENQLQQEIDEFTRQHSLVYCDGNLVSGSLEALIDHIVPTWAYYPDSTYVFSFLLSARLFIRPHELLSRISTKWDQSQQDKTCDVVDDVAHRGNNCVQKSTSTSTSPLGLCIGYGGAVASHNQKTEEDLCKQRLSAQNCIRLLSEWIETFPYDFRDERLMQQVRILARKCVYIDNALGKKVSCILQLLVQRLTVLEKYEDFLQSLTSSEFHPVKITPNKSVTNKTTASNTINTLDTNTAAVLKTESDLKTASKVIGHTNIQTPLQSLLTMGSSSFRTYPFEFHMQNLKPLHNPQSLNTSNSVNLTLHNLSDHYTNSNSASSINDVSGISDLCPSPAILAHQLTTIELERLSHIGPEEFVQAFAKEYHASQAYINGQDCVSSDGCGSATSVVFSTPLSDIKKTRNLESYIQWFNHLSYFTATEIVKYSKKKQRVRIIEYWIETARECFNIGNFNSLVAIIAGLNLAPISRLKKTWSKIQSAKFSVLEHQMDPTSNFNSYRSTLKAAMWRSEGATNERERIIIPFFSLFVKDLYFLNEGCSNRLENNHINFEKCLQLSKQVMEFNEWKKVSCPFEKLNNVIMFLQSSDVLNENMLSLASFECEPPENTQEKVRYKTLKVETKHQIQH